MTLLRPTRTTSATAHVPTAATPSGGAPARARAPARDAVVPSITPPVRTVRRRAGRTPAANDDLIRQENLAMRQRLRDAKPRALALANANGSGSGNNVNENANSSRNAYANHNRSQNRSAIPPTRTRLPPPAPARVEASRRANVTANRPANATANRNDPPRGDRRRVAFSPVVNDQRVDQRNTNTYNRIQRQTPPTPARTISNNNANGNANNSNNNGRRNENQSSNRNRSTPAQAPGVRENAVPTRNLRHREPTLAGTRATRTRPAGPTTRAHDRSQAPVPGPSLPAAAPAIAGRHARPHARQTAPALPTQAVRQPPSRAASHVPRPRRHVTPAPNDPQIKRANLELRRRLEEVKATGTIRRGRHSNDAPAQATTPLPQMNTPATKDNSPQGSNASDALDVIDAISTSIDSGASVTHESPSSPGPLPFPSPREEPFTSTSRTEDELESVMPEVILPRVDRVDSIERVENPPAFEHSANRPTNTSHNSAGDNIDQGLTTEHEDSNVQAPLPSAANTTDVEHETEAEAEADAEAEDTAQVETDAVPDGVAETAPLTLQDIHFDSQPIAQGGFGAVHRAHVDPSITSFRNIWGHNEIVNTAPNGPTNMAIKIMKLQDDDEVYAVDPVVAEKTALMTIAPHPMIIKQYAVFDVVEDWTSYLLMEFASRGDLQKLRLAQTGGIFQEDDARELAACILLGLQHVHASSFVHRDVKPENIVIGDDGRPKFIDFGFAIRLERGERNADRVGTVPYLAPEILIAREQYLEHLAYDSDDDDIVVDDVDDTEDTNTDTSNSFGQGFDRAVDLWAYGAMLYEMLVGYTPFRRFDPNIRYPRDVLMEDIARYGKGEIDLEFPNTISDTARDLMERLLARTSDSRLGMISDDEVRQHPWFQGIDWAKLLVDENPVRITLRAQPEPQPKVERTRSERTVESSSLDCISD